MHWLLHHWLLILCLVLIGFGIIVFATIWEAWYDIKSRKKEPMHWCHKHGFFRKVHTLPLFPHLNVDANVCPFCYREKVWTDPDKKLKQQ